MSNRHATAYSESRTVIAHRYLARLAGATAMWVEMQTLLAHGIAGKSKTELQSLVVEGNILAKRTRANRLEVWKKLSARYLLDPEHPAFRAFLENFYLETSTSQRGLLAYLLFAANDALVRRIGVEWLSPRFSKSGSVLKTEDLEAFVVRLGTEQPSVAQWSVTTRRRVLQHYLGAVRDFGLAQGKMQKRVLRPHVGSRPTVFAIRLAALQGLKPREVVQSEWFRLLGLDLNSTLTKLYQLNAEGLARFRVQGDVIELSL
jgi:hypothetical protein